MTLRRCGPGPARLRVAGSGAGAAAGSAAAAVGLDEAASDAANRHPDRTFAAMVDPPLEIVVDRERARFSAWYELFPRSASPEPGRHGTLRDVIARLPYVAGMGFDVLYLPPIHPDRPGVPQGPEQRRGRRRRTMPGSPWAIGADEGGHTAIHPDARHAGGLRALVAAAASHGIEIALDIAFQCRPTIP